jgi:protein-S-isoprenylcysteine O-methyltransferase Ste14
MNTARYIIAVLVLIGLPPGVLLWFFIHPFASFWRKRGPVWTYTVLGFPMVALMLGLFRYRRVLLGRDFGTSYPLIGLALLLFAAAATIALRRKKMLTFGVLAGLPELSESKYPGKLLMEGPYAKVRHPRYIEIFLATLSYSLFANHLGTYILTVATIPVLYLIVLLEERELRERFGEAYIQYSEKVPRFIPKLSRKASVGNSG